MIHDVFISHAAKDAHIAQAVCDRMEQRDMICWMAPRNVRPGYPYPGEIARAISNSKVMILILSGASNISDHVMREVGLAADCRIHIVQFCIEDVKPSDDLSYYLSLPHRVGAISGSLASHLDSLEKAIQSLLTAWHINNSPVSESNIHPASTANFNSTNISEPPSEDDRSKTAKNARQPEIKIEPGIRNQSGSATARIEDTSPQIQTDQVIDLDNPRLVRGKKTRGPKYLETSQPLNSIKYSRILFQLRNFLDQPKLTKICGWAFIILATVTAIAGIITFFATSK